MPERLTISNTSPLLYLNLINQLELLPKIYQTVTVPQAVVDELAEGAKQGVRVPDTGCSGTISGTHSGCNRSGSR